MQPGWIPQIFDTCELGVSTAFEPELIPDNQLVWMKNGVARGGKASTRPFLKQRLILPTGRIQGVSYFSIQKGMLIMQIAGHIYRIRIANKSFSYEEIPLTFLNSSNIPEVWMQETVGSFVIQDGQSYAIIYDGSTARRSDPTKSEVPMGRMMAFGNGRLWIAINDNELIAGDIKTKVFQSELKFTEGQYFSGGGAFYFPFAQRGLAFIPASGAAGYGALMVFGESQTQGVRADIASRNLWPDFPGFIQPVLLSNGAISHFSIVEENQDLFWRDGNGGIRSIRSTATSEVSGPGNTPISREIARITDFESVHRLSQCSSINLDNRLLMTASPFINIYGTTSYKNLISLDFAPMSSLRGKAPPAYDGQWEGINFVRLVKGKFQNIIRAFAVSTDDDGLNRLWEISDSGQADLFEECESSAVVAVNSPVPMVLEYPARAFGDPKRRKRLERCSVYLSGLDGESELDVYWRADNYQKWTQWDDVTTCAKTTDAAVNAPHVWKNLQKQERPQTKTFSIPDGINNMTDRALHVGFEFQVRIVLRGKGKIFRTVVYASMLDEEQFADRDDTFSDCIENDITGNEIQYNLTPSLCPPPPSIFLLDTTGILGLFDTMPSDAGGYVYNPGRFSTKVFRGIALWVSTGGTSRTLLHVFEAEDFTPGDILDYSSIIKGYSAPGVAREIFFTGLWLTGNGGDPLVQLPTQPVIESSSGAISLSNIDNINAAIEYYVFIGMYHTPPFTFVKWENNMGTLKIGDVTTDAAKTSLRVFMDPLPPISPA
jgi:hypothetical protein